MELCGVGCFCVLGEVDVGCGRGKKGHEGCATLGKVL